MKYKLFKANFEIWKHDIYILPTVRIVIDDLMYWQKSYSIQFHFLCLHARLLWLRRDEE